MSTAGTPTTGTAFNAEPKKLRNGVEQVKDDYHRIKDDVAGAGRDIAAAARTGLNDSRARVNEAIDSARESVGDAVASARETGARQIEDLQDKIADRPLTALGIAFGVGLVAGMVFSRRG